MFLLNGGLYQRMFRPLFFRLLVRSVECTGTRISRVLFGMEERLGRRMLCRMKGMTVFCWCRGVYSLWWLVGGCSRGGRNVVLCKALWKAGRCFCSGWKWRLRNWWSVCWLRWWYVVHCDWRCSIFLFCCLLCLSVWCLKWPVCRLCQVRCWCWFFAVGKDGNFLLARIVRHRRSCPLWRQMLYRPSSARVVVCA